MGTEHIPWPHAPSHRLNEAGTFMVTAGTYRKEHFFQTPERLDVLQRGLLKLATQFGWQLEAWAIFSNHYHFIGHSPPEAVQASSLSPMLKEFHSKTASWINHLDQKHGRKVWHNFYESRLTFERSYLARLDYVHQNPVHHRLVPIASQYRWCSAAWFERSAPPAKVRTIYQMRTDSVKVSDDYPTG